MGFFHGLAKLSQFCFGWMFKNLAIGGGSFLDAEAHFASDERRDAIEEKIVEAWARLTANFDDVFESGGGDEGDASSLFFAAERWCRRWCHGEESARHSGPSSLSLREFSAELRRWRVRDRRGWRRLSEF
jgi:hypothetical protein